MPYLSSKKELGREYVTADEPAIIAAMVQQMKDQLNRLYEGKKMLRQIHTKMHGCVKASFIIEPELDDMFKVGLFKDVGTYPAWVRFSNSNTVPKPDKKKDIRGIGIKIMGVPGEKILNARHLELTQDFLLMSSETFFSKNLKQFSGTLKASTAKSKLKLLLYFLNPMHWGLAKRLIKSFIVCTNPLGIPYWSTQPYQFGSQSTAVKYFLQPSPDNNLSTPETTNENYLRLNLATTLAHNEATFDFCVQIQTDADAMPIEDPTVPWTSPFIKLATIKIPPQDFDSPAQIEFGENLNFNSWHSLPAHRPLGSFNRARKIIYDTMSNFRHSKNQLPVFEPKNTEGF